MNIKPSENESRFAVGPVIQFLGSLVCTWVIILGKVPDVQAGKVALELETLSKLHSEGLINESDYERKKRELLNEA